MLPSFFSDATIVCCIAACCKALPLSPHALAQKEGLVLGRVVCTSDVFCRLPLTRGAHAADEGSSNASSCCCCWQVPEAMRLGHEAAAYVSGNFPKEMELKFEKVAQPFLLLHVNRCRNSCCIPWIVPASRSTSMLSAVQ